MPSKTERSFNWSKVATSCKISPSSVVIVLFVHGNWQFWTDWFHCLASLDPCGYPMNPINNACSASQSSLHRLAKAETLDMRHNIFNHFYFHCHDYEEHWSLPLYIDSNGLEYGSQGQQKALTIVCSALSKTKGNNDNKNPYSSFLCALSSTGKQKPFVAGQSLKW